MHLKRGEGGFCWTQPAVDEPGAVTAMSAADCRRCPTGSGAAGGLLVAGLAWLQAASHRLACSTGSPKAGVSCSNLAAAQRTRKEGGRGGHSGRVEDVTSSGDMQVHRHSEASKESATPSADQEGHTQIAGAGSGAGGVVDAADSPAAAVAAVVGIKDPFWLPPLPALHMHRLWVSFE